MTRGVGHEGAKPAVSVMDALRDNNELAELLSAWQWQAVHAARRDGASWAQIAATTGATAGQAHAGDIAVLDRQEQVLGRDVNAYRGVL